MVRFIEQVRQVALTYTTLRLAMFIIAGGLAAFVLLVVSEGRPSEADPYKWPETSSTNVGPFTVILAVLLAIHVKAQFAHPKAVLTPRFRAPHLLIPAVILAALMIGLPGFVAWWTRCDPWGTIAYASTCVAISLWSVQRDSALGIVLAVAFGLCAPLEAVITWWIVPNEELIALRALIAVGGWLAAAGWLWRVSRLREEMDGYGERSSGQQIWPGSWAGYTIVRTTAIASCQKVRPSSPAENMAADRQVAWPPGLSRLLDAGIDRWQTQHQSGDPSSLSGRVRMNYVLNYGLSPWPVDVASLIWTCILLFVGILAAELLPHPLPEVLYSSLAILVVGFSGMSVINLASQRRQMAGELMLPMTRAQLIDDLFAAIARQVAVSWTVLHLVALLLVTLYPHPSISPPFIVMFALFSASLMAITFGLYAYFAARPSALPGHLAAMFYWMPLFGLFILWTEMREDLGAVPILSLTLFQLIAALAIVPTARTRWLNLELG